MRAWLFAILHGGFRGSRRSMARRGPHGRLQNRDEPGQNGRQGGAMMATDVSSALQTLPKEPGAVLLLTGVEELSHASTVRVLDVPSGTSGVPWGDDNTSATIGHRGGGTVYDAG